VPTLPSFVSFGVSQGSTGTIAPPWGAHQTDDIGFLVIETSNQGAVTLASAQGFTAVDVSPAGVGDGAGTLNETQLTLFWQRATSGAMPTPIVADVGNHQVGQVVVFRSCRTTPATPWTASSASTEGVSTSAVTWPGTATAIDNSLVVLFAANGVDNTTNALSGVANPDLTSLTVVSSVQTDLGHGGGFHVVTGAKATAGTVSITTGTLASASQQGKIVLVLAPVTVPVVSSSTPPWVVVLARDGDWVSGEWLRPYTVD
jgi:hypothetical protein